jgi:eukaryotic-like serine/threonine-protein kinase
MSTTAILADREGRVVDGRFTLHRWLGGSPESSVYLTEAAKEGAVKAAIKLVSAASPGADARLAGWTAVSRLAHPHLLRVLHVGRSRLDGDEVVYVVTEYADEVLAEILPERALTPDETTEMLEPVLDALACLHGRGFAHGRIKPSNVLVVADRLKLSADCLPIASGKTAGPMPVPGAHDAPELSRGVISPAADIWSLGMIVVAALNQRAPAWDRDSGFEPVVRPLLPEPFAEIVRECLRLDAARRPALSEIKDRLEGKVPEQAETATSEREPEATSRWAAVWIVAAVFLGVSVTALILHSRQSPSPAPAADQVTSPQESSPQPPPPAVAQAPPPSAPARPVALRKPSPTPSSLAAAHSAYASRQAAARTTTSTTSMDRGVANGAILKRVLPEVLPSARATIRGTVRIDVRVQVDPTGAVTDAASESPGASHYFNKIALQAAQEWQFAPAQSGSQIQPSVWILHFAFRPEGATVTAGRQTH